MEFDGEIHTASGTSLGHLNTVEAKLCSLFPGISFRWTPTGAEKLAEWDSLGIASPDALRKLMFSRRSRRVGQWTDGTIEVSVNLGSEQDVQGLKIAISGDDGSGNSVFALLSTVSDWCITSVRSYDACPVCKALVSYTSRSNVTCPHCSARLLVTHTERTFHHLGQIDPEVRGSALGILYQRLHPVGTQMCVNCEQIYPAKFECCPRLIDVAFRAFNNPEDCWRPNTALRISEFLKSHPIAVENTAQLRLIDITSDDDEDQFEYAVKIRDCLNSIGMAYVVEAIMDQLDEAPWW